MKQTPPEEENADFVNITLRFLTSSYGSHQTSDLISIMFIAVTGAQPCDQYPFMLIVKQPFSPTGPARPCSMY